MWSPFSSIDDLVERRLVIVGIVLGALLVPAVLWSGSSSTGPGLVGVVVLSLAPGGVIVALVVRAQQRSHRAWDNALEPAPAARDLPGAQSFRRGLPTRIGAPIAIAAIFSIPVFDSILNGLDVPLLVGEAAVLALLMPLLVKRVRDEAVVTDERLYVRLLRGWRSIRWSDVAKMRTTHDGVIVEATDGRVLVVAPGVRLRLRFQQPSIDPELMEAITARLPESASIGEPRRG